MNPDPTEPAFTPELANQLGYITPEQFRGLCGITECTEQQWNKRGVAPASARVGRQRLYPQAAVAEWIQRRVRDRSVGGDLRGAL